MEKYTPRYLVMVTAVANHNKYYKQIPNGDGTLTAEYGRVGSSCQRRTYPMSQWDKKYNEKLNKGYVDQTGLVEDLIVEKKPKEVSKYREIEDKAIAEIIERLQAMARKTISENYTISSDRVTQAMVDEAQGILADLVDIKDLESFNKTLLKLFTTIPRKMSNVSSYLAHSDADFPDIIKHEQDLLDVMQGQVIQHVAEDDINKMSIMEEEAAAPTETILEALGLEFSPCNDEDIATIKKLLGSCSGNFRNAWRVTNKKTQKKFDEYCGEEKIKVRKLLWHGSRNENWWSIINTGLVLKPTNAVITGKMFGYGIYFAPKARKSMGYTSLSGSRWAKGNSKSAFMALMDVAYGKPYDVFSYGGSYGSFNKEALRRADPEANCLHAHAGSMLVNDEIIFYDERQMTIKYLVEIGE